MNQANVTSRQLTDSLLQVLRTTFDCPALAYAEPPTPLTGGFWAEIFAVRFLDAPPELSGDLVARFMPEDLWGRRETVVQREVAAQGFPAPRIRAAGGADAGVGRAFMVMDRAPGAPLLSELSAGRAIVEMPRIVRRLPHLLGTTAAQLHQLDPGPVLASLARDVPEAGVGVDAMLTDLRVSAAWLGQADLVAATTWLGEHQPPHGDVVICHGDLHPFNLLVDGSTITLIDWTASQIAAPEYDIAFTTTAMRASSLSAPRPVRKALQAAAAWLANRFVASYKDAAAPHGITIDDRRLEWYTGLQCLRMLTEASRIENGSRAITHPFVSMRASLQERLDQVIASL